MNHNRFENWLRNVFATKDDEISCTECFDQVSEFVELEVGGQDAAAQLPRLKQHLEQCRACREEYEILRDLRVLEDAGELPSVDELRRSIL